MQRNNLDRLFHSWVAYRRIHADRSTGNLLAPWTYKPHL